MTCAPSQDSEHTAHPHSLIRVFAVCSVSRLGPKIFSAISDNSDQTGRMPLLIRFYCLTHRSFCWFCDFCRAVAKLRLHVMKVMKFSPLHITFNN